MFVPSSWRSSRKSRPPQSFEICLREGFISRCFACRFHLFTKGQGLTPDPCFSHLFQRHPSGSCIDHSRLFTWGQSSKRFCRWEMSFRLVLQGILSVNSLGNFGMSRLRKVLQIVLSLKLEVSLEKKSQTYWIKFDYNGKYIWKKNWKKGSQCRPDGGFQAKAEDGLLRVELNYSFTLYQITQSQTLKLYRLRLYNL